MASTSESQQILETPEDNIEEARRRSDAIDEEIRREAERLKRKGTREIKVMLLGQAESGKSTFRKQFQLAYASSSLEKERPTWKPVVYSNIIRAIHAILDAVDVEILTSASSTATSPTDFVSETPASPRDRYSRSYTSSPEGGYRGGTSGSPGSTFSRGSGESDWARGLSELRPRLLPLIALEDALAVEISGGISIAGRSAGAYVRTGWQALFTPTSTLSWLADPPPRAHGGAAGTMANLAGRQLTALREEIDELWQHPAVKLLAKNRLVELDECAPFFLDNINRIAQLDYLPSIDDILNVRLRSLGIIEHSYRVKHGTTDLTWLLYDVGGARGQRPSWIPYFDDAAAIIFLAPISAFDQYLEEDGRVNRIHDSLQLWSSICANRLLKKATLILLLNKTDLLKKKLKAGVKVRKFITSYAERSNTYEDVSAYFKAHFTHAHKRNDDTRRRLFVQFTSMLNVKESQEIIVVVNNDILMSHMKETGLIE